MAKLANMPNGQKRLAAFSADLASSIQTLARRTTRNGIHVWMIGDRSICGHKVPMGQLLTEIMAEHGIRLLHMAGRRIVSKKMAYRNALSDTMSKEHMFIGQKS